MRGKPGFRRWAARYERASISRRNFVPFTRLTTTMDIRHVLPSIYAPTLVVHARGDRAVQILSGRYLAEHIVGARFVELPTDDHAVWFGARDTYLDAMQQFLTGTRPNADHSRKLATVLFTDIVDSTANAERVGDDAWRDVLDRHDDLSRIEIGVCGGRWIKSSGDGLLAGLHTGEIETRGDDVAGMTVHQAARVQDVAENSEVIVSSAVNSLVASSGITLESCGTHSLKGISAPCALYRVVDVSA
jgi:class 3 adenylate cyclase